MNNVAVKYHKTVTKTVTMYKHYKYTKEYGWKVTKIAKLISLYQEHLLVVMLRRMIQLSGKCGEDYEVFRIIRNKAPPEEGLDAVIIPP